MAKRKRASTPVKKGKIEVPVKPKTAALVKAESGYFQELVDTSNRLTQLRQQKSQFEFVAKKLQQSRKKIQTGEIKLPVTLPLIPNVMNYSEYDKKTVLKFFDEQIATYQNNAKNLVGQIEHRYEEYEECAVRAREFMNKRFGHLVAAHIVPDRSAAAKEDETNIFEADFKKMMKKNADGSANPEYDPDVKKKFDEAKKKAIKENTARATKKGK